MELAQKDKHFKSAPVPTRLSEKNGVKTVVMSTWQGRNGRGDREKMVIGYEYSYIRGIVIFTD